MDATKQLLIYKIKETTGHISVLEGTLIKIEEQNKEYTAKLEDRIAEKKSYEQSLEMFDRLDDLVGIAPSPEKEHTMEFNGIVVQEPNRSE